MKRIIALLLALTMCVSVCAAAESAPAGSVTRTVKSGDTIITAFQINMSSAAKGSFYRLSNGKWTPIAWTDRIYKGDQLAFIAGGAAGTAEKSPSTQKTEQKKPESTQKKPSSTTSGTTYTVKPGDTLTKICGSYSAALECAKRNGLSSPDALKAGMVITLGGTAEQPKKDTSKTETVKKEESKTPAKTEKTETSKTQKPVTYTVKAGDTLTKICGSYTAALECAKRNGLSSPNAIKVGMVLTLSGGEQDKSNSKTETAKKEESKTPAKNETSKTQKPVTYTVKAGDTLTKICGSYKAAVECAKRNGLSSPDAIKAGMVITLSGEVTKPAEEDDKAGKPAYYTVKAGDNLTQICGGYKNALAVAKANGLASPDRIKSGMVLTIPAGLFINGSAIGEARWSSNTSKNEYIVINQTTERLTLYAGDGSVIASTMCATGRAGYDTPNGTFKGIQAMTGGRNYKGQPANDPSNPLYYSIRIKMQGYSFYIHGTSFGNLKLGGKFSNSCVRVGEEFLFTYLMPHYYDGIPITIKS